VSTVRSVRLESGTAGLTAGALDRLIVAEAGEQQSPLPAPRRRVHAPDYHTHTHTPVHQCRINANRGPWQLFARGPLLMREKRPVIRACSAWVYRTCMIISIIQRQVFSSAVHFHNYSDMCETFSGSRLGGGGGRRRLPRRRWGRLLKFRMHFRSRYTGS